MGFLFLIILFIESGTILSSAQSPPPITFPARAVAIFDKLELFLKNESRYDDVISSVAPLLALYGSNPPIGSSSIWGLLIFLFS